MPILRQIAQHGNPVLRKVANQRVEPGDSAVQMLIDDLLPTMVAVNGAGIAAPQGFEPLSSFKDRTSPKAVLPKKFFHPMILQICQ